MIVTTINNALYVCFGTLVIFFDGARIECGLVGGGINSTIHHRLIREHERQVQRKYRNARRKRDPEKFRKQVREHHRRMRERNGQKAKTQNA